MVAFRSVRNGDADDRLLYELDARAHEEAISHTGLVHYFGGELDAERRCLPSASGRTGIAPPPPPPCRSTEMPSKPRPRCTTRTCSSDTGSPRAVERSRSKEIEPPQPSEALADA